MTTQTLEKINEQFGSGWLSEATIGEGVINNICLCGPVSKNGRTYLESCFKGGSVYEGRPVFLDHNVGDPIARSVKDLAGTVVNARMQNSKPYGDIKLLETPAGDLLQKVAKASPSDVGMSHSANGTFTDSTRKVVESLDEVFSVDVVMFPATTKSFSEQTSSETEQMTESNDKAVGLLEKQVDAAQAKIGELTENVTKIEGEKKLLKENFDALQVKFDELKEKHDADSAELQTLRDGAAVVAMREKVLAELKEAKLDIKDETAVPESFIESLAGIKDDEIRGKLISDRAKIFVGSGDEPPVYTRERNYNPGSNSGDNKPSTADNVNRLFGPKKS